jgi:hypothetical protein
MLKWVILEHRLPDGSWHLDWLTEREVGGPLVSFRLSPPPDQGPGSPLPASLWAILPGRLAAERMPDHRRDYLAFEGEVSGGRGTVRRVAEGLAAWLERSDDLLEVGIHEGPAKFRVTCQPHDGDVWSLTVAPG